MAESAVIEAPRAEVVGPEPTLDDLATTAKTEHELCLRAARKTVEHAVRAGEALLAVRERTLPDAAWSGWLATNFPFHRRQAYAYIRLAMYKEQIPDGYSVKAAEELLKGKPGLGGPRPRLEDAVKADARRMREGGASYKQIAKALDLSPATVHYWFNSGSRSQRDKKARTALRAAEKDSAIKRAVGKTGGALAEAYSMAERLDDVLGQAHREATEPAARRELGRAHEFQRAMRDAIVRALGVEA